MLVALAAKSCSFAVVKLCFKMIQLTNEIRIQVLPYPHTRSQQDIFFFLQRKPCSSHSVGRTHVIVWQFDSIAEAF